MLKNSKTDKLLNVPIISVGGVIMNVLGFTARGFNSRSVFTGVDSSEVNSLIAYFKYIACFPLLKKEEELDLAKKINELKEQLSILEIAYQKNEIPCSEFHETKQRLSSRLQSSRSKMINSNLRLVVAIAKKYHHPKIDMLDLINEGNIGLMEAIEHFDYERGCRFSTYGSWWIHQAIIKAIAEKGRSIRIPANIQNLIRKCTTATKYLTQTLGRAPDSQEIAEFMNLPEEKLTKLLSYNQEMTSLDTTIDEENEVHLGDVLHNEGYKGPFEAVFEKTLPDILKKALKKLSFREAKIIELRYGLSGQKPQTLESIGGELGMTKERVRQIQNKALSKLREFTDIKALAEVM